MERKEVTIYGFETNEQDSRAVKVIDSGDGTYALSVILDAKSTLSSSGILLDHSGTIAVNDTAQEVMPENVNRKYLLIQNISSISLWIGFNTDAVADQPSIELLADGSFVMEGSFICTQSVSIIGSVAGSAFVAKQGVLV